jgi:LysR family transcriptional regulator, mexEF-oprN operon transcriptional activator
MQTIPSADLLNLRVLAVVVQEGSVSRAAQSLHVTQPAVSNALAKLRQRLNDPLFIKVGRRIVPTERARLLAHEAKTHLHALQGAMGSASVFTPTKATQRFMIGVPDYLETLLAPLLLARILQAAPHASIAFKRHSAEDLSAALDLNQIDLALSRTDDIPPWQNAQHVLTERFVVLHSSRTMPATTRLSMAQFLHQSHAMVTFTGEGKGQMDALLATKGKERRVVVLVSSFSSLAEIVKQAPVIASVPHPIGYRMAKMHRLCVSEFGFKVQPIAIKLVRTRARAGDGALNWFTQIVKESLLQINELSS